jgi:hypothetical protein
MATALQALRDSAKKLGVPSKEIRSADRQELERLVADAKANGKPSKKAARKAVKKATVAKPTRKTAQKSAPAKSAKKGTAKRQTAQKASKPKASGYQAKGGRNMLDGVNFSDTDGWNPRPGSAPDRIVKCLRKFKGNRDKVFDALVGDIGDFVPAKRKDGSKWDKGDHGTNTRKGMLRYRISRTAWQFAVQTGQHESSTNRVEYGTGGTGQGTFKRAKSGRKTATTKKAPAKAKATTKKATARKTTAKAGRKATRKAVRR